MSSIVLATINARYLHTSFSLRYLQANLQELEPHSELLELTPEERPIDCLEKLLALEPKVVGFSVYIWNATATLDLLRLLRRVAPEVLVVLGGPEVSYEWQDQELFALCDYLITHEGDLAFPQLCRQLLQGERPAQKVIAGGQPPLEKVALPYRLYSDHDLEHRVVYVEASRGCPFRCEFCLSSLDKATRHFDLDRLLQELQHLLDRGARRFKFIDRTFNLRLDISQQLLTFFLDRWVDDLFLHFEMVPDRFPLELRELVARFPDGAVQFEIGIQSFDPEVQKRISRRQDLVKLEDNLAYLRDHTGVHVHADLIVGLPGETMSQFAQGFDRLVALRPQEIQVGILKRLRGTPILRHDQEYAMVYSPSPPYEVLSTGAIPFQEMMKLKRFSRMWDVVANRGRFPRTLPLLLDPGPFERFMAFTQWAVQQWGSTKDLALPKVAEALFRFLVDHLQMDVAVVTQAMVADYTQGNSRYLPGFLHERDDVPKELLRQPKQLRAQAQQLPSRQARHLAHKS